MKASIAHGWRPSVLILGKDSRKQKITQTDITLSKAYQRFLNELCAQCGYPKYLCHNDDNRIQFRLARDECAATAMAEGEQRRIAKAAEKNPDSMPRGVRIYAEPYLTEDAVTEGKEFSDFRRPYLMERARALGLIPEDTPIPEP